VMPARRGTSASRRAAGRALAAANPAKVRRCPTVVVGCTAGPLRDLARPKVWSVAARHHGSMAASVRPPSPHHGRPGSPYGGCSSWGTLGRTCEGKPPAMSNMTRRWCATAVHSATIDAQPVSVWSGVFLRRRAYLSPPWCHRLSPVQPTPLWSGWFFCHWDSLD
jgi:hypothetical protein